MSICLSRTARSCLTHTIHKEGRLAFLFFFLVSHLEASPTPYVYVTFRNSAIEPRDTTLPTESRAAVVVRSSSSSSSSQRSPDPRAKTGPEMSPEFG